jgi:hypothetical protein
MPAPGSRLAIDADEAPLSVDRSSEAICDISSRRIDRGGSHLSPARCEGRWPTHCATLIVGCHATRACASTRAGGIRSS